MKQVQFYISRSTNPYENLAIEEYLLDHLEMDAAILYLWQNQNTVVIGKNQNCWKECKIHALEAEGGHLARRLSGGGAVYHDLGNVNFTFILKEHTYNVSRQLDVILAALKQHGIEGEKSGRNDLIITNADKTDSGQKFSGNAFYSRGENCYHHGTIMLDVDKEFLSRYLQPSVEKLQFKGVSSVRSRVINLKEIAPDLTVPALQESLRIAFEKEYGQKAREISGLPIADIEQLTKKYASSSWKYGKGGDFSLSIGHRFSWGEIEIAMETKAGHISNVAVYSDAMNSSLIASIAPCLQNRPFNGAALGTALTPLEKEHTRENRTMIREIREFLCIQDF